MHFFLVAHCFIFSHNQPFRLGRGGCTWPEGGMHRGGRGYARASCASPLGTPLSLTIFSLNLAENYQPVNELYQTTDHPAPSPKSCQPEWRVAMAGEFDGSGITMWKTRGKYLPFDLAGGGGGGASTHPCPTYTWNACRFLFLLSPFC